MTEMFIWVWNIMGLENNVHEVIFYVFKTFRYCFNFEAFCTSDAWKKSRNPRFELGVVIITCCDVIIA